MAAPILRIRLFGALELRLGEAALPPLESGRAESLLAYLLLNRDAPRARQHLAFLLWPDSAEAQARTNLRHVLHNLRRGLPSLDRYLEVTPRTLQWRADAPCWLDVAAFEAALARAEREGDGEVAALQEAADLYAGDLLAGCYDEWILGERERLQQRYLGAMARLADLLEARGDQARAIGYGHPTVQAATPVGAVGSSDSEAGRVDRLAAMRLGLRDGVPHQHTARQFRDMRAVPELPLAVVGEA